MPLARTNDPVSWMRGDFFFSSSTLPPTLQDPMLSPVPVCYSWPAISNDTSRGGVEEELSDLPFPSLFPFLLSILSQSKEAMLREEINDYNLRLSVSLMSFAYNASAELTFNDSHSFFLLLILIFFTPILSNSGP